MDDVSKELVAARARVAELEAEAASARGAAAAAVRAIHLGGGGITPFELYTHVDLVPRAF